jgi:Asp-tRNA(Asn)/Glu-tRNA(Gln) amidotransferase A subunit family amidase
MPLDLRPPGPAWPVLYALDNGRAMTGLTEAAAIRRHHETAPADLFGQVDALVTPTTPGVAYGYDQHETGMSAGDLCWAST